jgi:hypothetical protein
MLALATAVLALAPGSQDHFSNPEWTSGPRGKLRALASQSRRILGLCSRFPAACFREAPDPLLYLIAGHDLMIETQASSR